MRLEAARTYSFAEPASKSARASARDLVSSLCGLGLRLSARGSTRSGRLPTWCAGRCLRCTLTNTTKVCSSHTESVANESAIFCMADVEINGRDDQSADTGAWSMDWPFWLYTYG